MLCAKLPKLPTFPTFSTREEHMKRYKGPIIPVKCSSCGVEMEFRGLYDLLMDGSSAGDVLVLVGQAGEQISVRVYVCPKCQKYGFYEEDAKTVDCNEAARSERALAHLDMRRLQRSIPYFLFMDRPTTDYYRKEIRTEKSLRRKT